MRTTHWPLFGLCVHTPRLELRYVDDELADELADLSSRAPIHDPATMPFSVPWTDIPVDERSRQSLQHFWGGRASWTPDDWRCPMAVIIDGDVVGAQDVGAKHFRVTRSVTTGSWLTQTRQGTGIGKEMRSAILHLAFEGLGAERAHTSAYHDNLPSLGVTRALGYEPNGEFVEPRRDGADLQLHFLMTRERWLERRRDDIRIEGLEPCLELFGATRS
jgi:RimJ/RimL family protein N-acetyltransferase